MAQIIVLAMNVSYNHDWLCYFTKVWLLFYIINQAWLVVLTHNFDALSRQHHQVLFLDVTLLQQELLEHSPIWFPTVYIKIRY